MHGQGLSPRQALLQAEKYFVCFSWWTLFRHLLNGILDDINHNYVSLSV